MSDNSPGTHAFVMLQHLLPQHALSRLIWLLTRSRLLKTPLVSAFVRGFKPDLSDAVERNPQRYRTFNEFFTRALRDGTRPMPQDPAAIASPVDGTVSMAGHIDGGLLMQAKGQSYTLDRLLADQSDWTAQLQGGSYATIYLAPYNYHRIHMPMGAVLEQCWYVPGRLFSVNAATAGLVPGLFARNERLICAFSGAHGRFAVVLVGALFVGSMSTVWHGEVTPRRRWPATLPVPANTAPLTRGAEFARFNMGSTVILLMPPGMGSWHADLQPGALVRVGQNIGQLDARRE